MNAIILVGKDLGANLAIETAAAHPDLAGVVLEQPLASPTLIVFSDARAHLVPAHWLVSDRWQTSAAAGNILIPSLWFYWTVERSADLHTGQAGSLRQSAGAQNACLAHERAR